MKLRKMLKVMFPMPVRRVIRACLHYVQRLWRWAIVLWQVRGFTWRDQWILLGSAMASPVTALSDILSWQDPVLLSDADVLVAGAGRFHVRARCDDLWHVLPWQEARIHRYIERALVSGDVFVDAGANIGFYTVQAARLVGEKGRVISFEMMPDTALRLRRNVSLNGLGNVVIHENALSNSSGECVRAAVSSGKFGQASIERAVAPQDRIVEVVTTTLDDALSGITRIRLLKMDLEGAEVKAMDGASEVIKRTQAVIYERWPALIEGDPVGEWLLARGFIVRQLDGSNMLAERPE